MPRSPSVGRENWICGSVPCGHVVEQSVHHTNREPSFSTQWCPECELTRGVVESEKVVEAAAQTAEANRRRDEKISQAERELKNAERVAAGARKKLAALQVDL